MRLKRRPSFYAFLVFLLAFVTTSAFLPRNPHDDPCRETPSFLLSRHKSNGAFCLQAKKSLYDDSAFGPFEEGDVGISRNGYQGNRSFFSLYYRIYNRQEEPGNTSQKSSKLPLVVLHGGPSLPSQYLYPMVSHLKDDRLIVFYDQLGCGKSDEPRETKFYSIEQSVADLDMVLQTLGFNEDSRIHLFGHSYGGNLAYEYAKKRPQLVQSLVLSNTPTSTRAAGDAYDRIASRNPLGFWKQRVCTVENPALDNALQHVEHVWVGMDAVLDYVALPPFNNDEGVPSFPRWTLVITCSLDFAAESSSGWNDILSRAGVRVEQKCLEHCAHYPHLEDGASFGRLLDEFLSKHDR